MAAGYTAWRGIYLTGVGTGMGHRMANPAQQILPERGQDRASGWCAAAIGSPTPMSRGAPLAASAMRSALHRFSFIGLPEFAVNGVEIGQKPQNPHGYWAVRSFSYHISCNSLQRLPMRICGVFVAIITKIASPNPELRSPGGWSGYFPPRFRGWSPPATDRLLRARRRKPDCAFPPS